MLPTRKEKGYNAEELVLQYYQKKGLKPLRKNFTIPGGEIDLIVESSTIRRFIEVKCVDYLKDYVGYITYAKRKSLKRTLMVYNNQYPTSKFITIDVVFVRKNHIVQIFEDITQ